MARSGRFQRRAAVAVAFITASVLLVNMRPSPASAATNVTAVNGSAYGYRAFNISLFGGAQADTGPIPTAALATDASNSPQSGSATTALVQYGPATMLTGDAISLVTSGSLGTSGSVSSSSTATNLNKATTQPASTGSEVLTADSVNGSCTASGSGTSGSATITNGSMVTDNSTTPPTVTPVPTSPAANTTISGKLVLSASDTETFNYVFNEQTTDASGNLTVNAVDEYLLGPTAKGNVVVGHVVCGVTAVTLTPQTITYTSTAPANAVLGGPTYAVSATGGGSGNPVTFTIDASASSVCSISGTTVSFIGVGTCTIDANQAGNGTFAPAPQAQQSFAVGKGAQAITFTSTAPSGATVGGPTYMVTATGGASGNPVTFAIDSTASSVCSLSGATVSFTGGGTCVIDANQAGSASYNAAPQAQQSFAVGKAGQTITFTSTAPTTAAVGGPTYAVTATASSGLTVTFTIDLTATSVCSISGSTVSFTAVGTCTVDGNQAGNASFTAAPQVQQSFAVGKGSQTVSFTSTAPTAAVVGGPTYTATATASSGLAVTLTIDATASSVCSISGSTVSFTGAGTCVIDANQAGNANFNAAPQVQQSFAVGKGSQTITFTSTAPSNATPGGPTYAVTATASSGLTVTFTIDATASSVCSISGSTVSFTAAGTCVIDANQAGNANFNAAPQAQQSFSVGKASQTITFTSTAPTTAVVGGPTYAVTATASSGLPVTFTIDSTATSVCSISGSTVSFTAVGTCRIDGNQGGNANFNAAPQVQQSFAVGKGSQTISYTSSAPTSAVVGGATYAVSATGGASGNPVTFTIDATASSVCSISGSTVSFTGAGTCVIDANQAGNANYNAAAQVQQSFAVGKANQTVSFTSTAPTAAVVGGPTYTATATASSGLTVALTIDSSASSVCTISGGTVSFTGTGTCVIDANQAGNANFNAAPQVQQSFAVGKGSQTITFTSTAPSNATPGGPTYTVTATGGASGNPVTFTIDATASAVCSISGSTVSFTAAGSCLIDANQAGNANYNAAAQAQQSFSVGKAAQTITFTSTAPTTAVVGGPTYAVTATASSGLPVTFTIDSTATSVCSISGSTVSFTAVGTCRIDGNQAGNANFNAAPQVQQSFAVGKGAQTITFTSTAPTAAVVGGATYAVTATGGASGNPVTFTIDATASSVCSVSGSTVSFTGAGTCVIDANQAGNANYNAAAQAQQSFAVGKASQTISYTSTAPTAAVVGGPTYAVTATASSGLTVALTIDSSASSVCSISGGTVSFTGAGTCVIDANQAGNANFNAAPQVQQSFAVGKGAQTITFTSTAPSNATPGGSTYMVTATGGASGNAVTFTIDATASAVCSISGSTVSFTAAGTCLIDANQAGNANYNAAAQAQQSFGVGKAAQTITFTSTAPTTAVVGGPTYSATATASSGLPVTLTIDTTATSVCSISGSTVSFTGTGTCVIDANQAGNANFNAAPQVQQSFAVGKGAQTITFTSTAPTTAVVGGTTYAVTATGGASGNPVTFTIDATAASVCSISGSTVSFTGAGTCVVDANQAGNATYNAAAQAQQSFAVGKGAQTISFTSSAPTGAAVGGPSYLATATASSGLPVALTIDSSASSVCSISGGTVSFTGAGTCVIDANQAGSANFNAAAQVQQSFAVGKGAQAITFTSAAPSNAAPGGPTYTVTATGGGSGNPVTFTIDSTASSVCSISGATVSFLAAGTCVIDANQAGNANYNAAAQAQQSFGVGKAAQTITFTSTAPTTAVVGGPTYSVTATASSGLTVTFTIDSTATSVCSISGSTVSFTAAGTCRIDGNQAGNANFNAAPQVQQSFAVGKGSQTITFTSTAPTAAVVGGATYAVTGTGGASGNPVTFTIDATASSVCSISGSTVSFTGAGTCVIDANQAGNTNYNAAAQAQQSFAVGKASQTITFTSSAPSGAVVGGPSYTAAATASSGLTVALTIDSSASSVCSISGSTVSFTGAGTCVIDANQGGNANFNAAAQVQQSFAVGKGSQTITFTSTAPSNATPGGPTYTVTATGGASGNPVTFTIDATASSVCSISGSTVSFTAAGTCVIDANQAGNANYNAAAQAQQSFGVGKSGQTITFTSTAPTTAVVGGPSYTATATASSGLTVALTIDATASSVCSISGSTVSFTGAGTCVIDANQAGNANFNAAPQVQQSFAVGKGAQTITFTSTAPTAAVVGGATYAVTATGGGSGNPVTFTIDATAASVCSISGSTVSFTGAGTCVVDANQAGSANYNAAAQAQQSFAVGKGAQTITFTSTAPSGAVVGGPTYAATATASSGLTVALTIDTTAASVCSISGGTVSFTGAGTCVIDANQAGNADFNAAPRAQQSFTVGKGAQTISFTSAAPSNATPGGPTYTVTATGGASGNPVTFTIDSTATSVCSISGSTVSFTAAGTCVIDANQAGNANYNAAAQAQQSFGVGKAAQTITFTSTAPTGAVVGGPTYSATATASSGLSVTLTIDATAASVCSISGSTVSFTGAGTCVIDANQSGNVNFNAAPQVQQSFAVGKGAQTITFTSTAPTTAVVGGPTYSATATASSGLPVTLTIDATASSVCSISGSTVSFTGAGTCVIDANQTGNVNYNAAAQVQQSFAVGSGKQNQTITYTSSAPTNAVFGGPTYTVTATASSGLAVSFTIDSSASSVCSITGSTVSFTGAGMCVIDANQAGDASFNAAPQVQQSFAVGQASQTITFTSTAPAGAVVGGATYAVTATGGASGNPVTFTIDSTATSVCSISGSTVSFTGAGTCVIDANQAGNTNYSAAAQAQQSFAVGQGSQTITFTSTAPSPASVGGPTYTVTATGGASGNPVTFTIDASATSVCAISGATVSFTGAGTCVIDANQAGNANYTAAPQAQQSVTVTAAAPDPRISATGRALHGEVDQLFFDKVATFTDPDPSGTASDYRATIDWGDGTTSTGFVMKLGNGTFLVFGFHVWHTPGTLTVTVTIADDDSTTPTTTVTSTAIVHRS